MLCLQREGRGDPPGEGGSGAGKTEPGETTPRGGGGDGRAETGTIARL